MLFYLQHVADPTGSSPKIKNKFWSIISVSLFKSITLYFYETSFVFLPIWWASRLEGGECQNVMQNMVCSFCPVISNLYEQPWWEISVLWLPYIVLVIVIIALLHILSAYNRLLDRYKVYSSSPRECLCTR